MVYAYLRISTDKQTLENQKYEILNFANGKKLIVDKWVEETASGTIKYTNRELGKLISTLKESDVLILSEISRLGRSLMEIMSILNELMERKITVYTVKEQYELDNNLNSKVLAFAFSLSAEIERNMISQRTKEALARKKNEGQALGRPKGSLNKKVKLTGKDEEIKYYRNKNVSKSAIARILGVSRMTLYSYLQNRSTS
jgi:DNA invertase Pin-like site-specific DNA recombinase